MQAMQDIKKILIRFPNWLGDCVMATVIIEALAIAYPSTKIHAVIRKPFDEIFKKDTRIEKVFGFVKEKSFWKKLLPLSIKKDLKKENYDLAIVCTRSFSSAFELLGLKVPVKIGSKRFLGSFFLTHQMRWDKTHHQKKQYLSLLKPLNISFSSLESILEKPDNLDGDGIILGIDTNKPYILIHPGASYGLAKTWPLDYYKKLAKLLLENFDLPIVFCGDATQEKIGFLHKNLIDLIGKTTLSDLKKLIAKARCVICNDSGPMHIADGLKVPLVALFGPTDPILTGPMSLNSLVLNHKTPCGPCFKRTCPLDHACMKNLLPEHVFEKLKPLMGQYGSS